MSNTVNLQKLGLMSAKTYLILVGALFLIVDNALAQTSQPEMYSNKGTHEKVCAECRNFFYPRFEVRKLSDVPLTLLISRIDNKTTVGPAAGLDALGLWWNISRPNCVDDMDNPAHNVDDYRHFHKPTGLQLSAFLTANASYTVLSVNDSVKVDAKIPDPSQPGQSLTGTGTKEVETAKSGAYLSIGLGLLCDVRWLTSGVKRNRFAIGAMARYGWFAGTDKGVFSIGPLLNISID
jgi:hypothetical protein